MLHLLYFTYLQGFDSGSKYSIKVRSAQFVEMLASQKQLVCCTTVWASTVKQLRASVLKFGLV